MFPFSGITLWLSWVICDLEFEIRNRINCNFIFFKVGSNELIKKIILNVTVDSSFKTVIVTSLYERIFTLFGDNTLLMYGLIKASTY